MENGRFGPIRPDDKPKKRYRIDYNRLITFTMLVVIAVLAVLMAKDWKADKNAEPGIVTVPTPVTARTPGAPTAAPTLSPEELRPLPSQDGLLPIFYSANTAEKRVAITIDGCGNADNLLTLVGLCETFDAKLTFFPTGSELTTDIKAWAAVLLAGHEIENHTFSNAKLSQMSAQVKADEVGAQTSILRNIIGADYQPHFLRTNDYADDIDLELHAYLEESGYYGIARWSSNAPASFEAVEPGMIINYTANASGVAALATAIQVLAENGYEMVTLNDLFQYPVNMESYESPAA